MRVWPLEKWEYERVLLAVSGGADSVALLRAIVRLQPNRERIFVGHVNHGLRDSARNDSEFVQALCANLDVKCVLSMSEKRDIQERAKSEGIESAARMVRYEFLRKAANDLGCRYVLTAHTSDDQAETVIHNLARGTGLRGLAGISTYRRIAESLTLVRPLILINRNKVETYLNDLDQSFCHDETNSIDSYTRNRIRHLVLPEMEKNINSHCKEAICRTAHIVREAVELIEFWADRTLNEIVSQSVDEETVSLNRSVFLSSPKLMQTEILRQVWKRMDWPEKEMSFTHWVKLSDSCQTAGTYLDLPGRVRIATTSQEIIVSRNK